MAELNKLNSRIQLKRVSADSLAKHSLDVLPDGSPLLIGVEHEPTKRYMCIGDGKTSIGKLSPMVSTEMNNGYYVIRPEKKSLVVEHNSNSISNDDTDGIYGNIDIWQSYKQYNSVTNKKVIAVDGTGISLLEGMLPNGTSIRINNGYQPSKDEFNPSIQLLNLNIKKGMVNCGGGFHVGYDVVNVADANALFDGDVQVKKHLKSNTIQASGVTDLESSSFTVPVFRDDKKIFERTKDEIKKDLGIHSSAFIVDLVYPVGSVYIQETSKTSNENKTPMMIFPGTEWERLEVGHFLKNGTHGNTTGIKGGNSMHNHTYGLKYNEFHADTSGMTMRCLSYRLDKEMHSIPYVDSRFERRADEHTPFNYSVYDRQNYKGANEIWIQGNSAWTSSEPLYTEVIMWKRIG